MEIHGDPREFQGLTSASRQGGRGRLPRARMWEPARAQGWPDGQRGRRALSALTGGKALVDP